MFRKYKDYKYACLSRKNFIISQLVTFFSNAVIELLLILGVFYAVGFFYPLISAHIAR